MFEGELPKLFSFDSWLSKILIKINTPPKTTFSKDDLKFTGRVLASATAETNPPTPTSPIKALPNNNASPATSTSIPTTVQGFSGIDYSAEINNFRKEFGIQIKTGVTYSASEDFTKKYKTNFNDSIYQTSIKPLFNIANFSIDFDKNGANLLIYGYMTAINDTTIKQLLSKKTPRSSNTAVKNTNAPIQATKDDKKPV
jgi:hypothetical protein